MFNLPLIINVVLIIIFNKNIFFIIKAFAIVNLFLTLYNFYYRGK